MASHRGEDLRHGHRGRCSSGAVRFLLRWLYSCNCERCALSFSLTSRTALLKQPSEGSLAAAWHSSIGNAVAGSLFSILQSLGTKPLLLAGIGGLITAAGCVIHFVWESFWDEDQDGEPPGYSEK